MRDLRAVVYGVGEMGSIVTRLLLDKSVKIVGAVGRSPEKVGRDLGDVAGLGRNVGVAVDSDPHRALAVVDVTPGGGSAVEAHKYVRSGTPFGRGRGRVARGKTSH